MILSGKAERAFPRGGVVKKKKSENSDGTTVAKKYKENDDLFATKIEAAKKTFKSDSAKAKKKGNKKNKKDIDVDDILTVKQVDTLTYDDLTEGFTLLACVSTIKDLELKISLPGRLSATVPITQISRPYTDALKRVAEGENDDDDDDDVKPLSAMFRQGQLVVCSIVEVEKRDSDDFFSKVTASLAPHIVQGPKLDVNNLQGVKLVGAVKSIEDYGYVMDIGLQAVQAFLPKKKIEKYVNEFLDGEYPSVGQLVPCVVTQLNGPAAKLSAEPSKLRTNVTEVSKVSVHSILPGMTFEAKVSEKSVKNGIRIEFGEFSGFIHRHHLDKDISQYEPEEPVSANVLYISPTINTVYFSLKGHTKVGAKLVDPFESHKIGDLVSNVEVVDTSSKGLTIKIDENSTGFVPAKSISDSKVAYKDFKKEFLKGVVKASCRIFQFDFIDRHYICSLQKSMLKANQSIVMAENLKPGQKVFATIKNFVEQGVIVDIGMKQTKAFIQHLHLTDVPMTHPEKKFSVGDKLTCKVLRVDPSKRKIHLTSKPILVKKSDYEIVDTFDPSNVGKTTEGVVVKMSSQGLLLQLFGDVRGWVPKSKISSENVEHPEKLFFIGQALKCQVVRTDPENERMTLTLILGDGKFKPLGKKEKAASDHLRLGKLYAVKVESIASDGLNVVTVHVKAEDDEETSKEFSPVKCFVPTLHLTDHPALSSLILNTYHVDDVIEEAVCFEKDAVPIMSLKPSIVQFSKTERALGFSDMHEGMIMPCVVALVKPFGVFLRLPTWKFRKSALVPTRLLADFFVENPRDFVQPFQTLFGKVVETDEEKQTITMTSKSRMVMTGDSSGSVQIMSTFFDDLRQIRDNVTFEKLSELRLGTPVTCVVKEVNEFGLDVDVDGVRGIIPRASLTALEEEEEDFEAGDNLSAVVVFIDYQFSCVELSPDSEFVRHAVQAIGKPPPKAGVRVKARVVVTRSAPLYFVTMAIEYPHNYVGQLIHVSTRHHINDQQGHTDLYVVGDVHKVVIKKSDEDFTIGVLEKHDRKRTRRNSVEISTKRTRRESEPSESKTEPETDNSAIEIDDNDEVEVKTEDVEIKVEIKEEDPGWEAEYNPWGVGLNGSNDADKNGEVNAEKSKKLKTHLSKKEKKELDRLEAEEIARAEQRVLDGEEAEPETAEEFDRLVMASPNSSLCWIKYMAFYISKSNHEKAREIAKRALEKIHFREEAERLNVYLALFNMENACKNEEAAENVLKEALKCNDQYNVYQRVAATYSLSEDQNEKAEKIFKIMARKFCKEPDVWTQLGQFYFKTGNLKDARFTLQRGLQNLETKHHVDLSSKFAQMEFKVGEAERGKTIFENIVANYPKRTDQWSVYVDMVIKKGEHDAAREIFERMIQLNLQPKKMKFFFKKYLEFETSNGDQHTIDKVRKKALQYVESKFGVADVDPVEELMDTLDEN